MRKKIFQTMAVSLVISMFIYTFAPTLAFAVTQTENNEDTYMHYNSRTKEITSISQKDVDKIAESLRNKEENNSDSNYIMTGIPTPNETTISPTSIIDGKEITDEAVPDVQICYIYSTFNVNGKTETKFGTGFLIYKNIVLTAGHCIYGGFDTNEDKKLDWWGYAESCAVFAGLYQGEDGTVQYAPGGKAIIGEVDLFVTENFINTHSSKDDWGLITLEENSGLTGLGIGCWGNWNNLLNQELYVQGYPGEKETKQYITRGKCTKVSGYNFAHTASTIGGMSGAPIRDSGPYVFGVHVAGKSSDAFDKIEGESDYNVGISINRDRFNFLVAQVKNSKFYTGDYNVT